MKRRRLKDNQIFGRDVGFEVVDDVNLYILRLCGCSCLSIFGLPGVVCERIDDDNIVFVETCLSDFVEGLGEGVRFVEAVVVIAVTVIQTVDRIFNFGRGNILKVAIMK